MSKLSHLNKSGEARMVDVSGKDVTHRTARARALVRMKAATLEKVRKGNMPKGDVFSTARIAGIMGAKKTHELIPLCHPLNLSKVDVSFEILERESAIEVISEASLDGKTGVEMEALTAASIAALTLYDMIKAVEKGVTITDVSLLEKTGGKSGTYRKD